MSHLKLFSAIFVYYSQTDVDASPAYSVVTPLSGSEINKY